MSKTVGDFFWERLSERGIRRVFGFPGNGINGLVGALDRARDRYDFVQVQHEEFAMARSFRPAAMSTRR